MAGLAKAGLQIFRLPVPIPISDPFMSVFQKGVNKVALWLFQNIALLVWVVQPAQHSNVDSANGVSLGRHSMSDRPVACKWNVREIGLKETLYLRFGLVLQIAQKLTHFTFNILCVCVHRCKIHTLSQVISPLRTIRLCVLVYGLWDRDVLWENYLKDLMD